MAMQPGLTARQTQRLAMTPGMRTSLAMLRMPADQLIEEIAREAAENPLLVVTHRTSSAGFAGMDTTEDAPLSLFVSLAKQISQQRLPPEVTAAALLLARELREDGYLDIGLHDLSQETGLPVPDLEAGLAALQTCDPPGVGARTLQECLALKLIDAGESAVLARAIVARLDDIAEDRWASVAQAVRVTPSDVQRIGAVLRTLSSVPVERPAPPILTRIPDVIVEVGPAGPVPRVNPDVFPRVSATAVPATANEHMRAYGARATAFLAAFEARSRTLLRIVQAILDAQQGFFAGSTESLRPLSRAEVSDGLALHVSTLARAIQDKSLAFGGKTFPLVVFFSHALPQSGGVISVFDVQRRIRVLIASEDSAAPLADEAIAAQLKDEGVDIARRTVAKYRKCMRIPSSFERRRRKLQKAASQRRTAAEPAFRTRPKT
jgi:RNA polymerase sigma-54 factor